jgi:hypothetical protein
MATDIPSKSKINFDVYERADPSSQIDWGEQAKKITDTFTGIRDERQKKKDEIEKAFQDQQTALTDIGEYDNPTIQQFVMNGGQDVSNKLLDVQNLVQRGLMKPSDATMWQHNAKTGFDLLKKNAAQYDKTFTEYTTRLQEQMEGSNLSVGAPGEQWMAKQLEGFANMNNMQLEADPETGNMVMLKVDENGQPIPGESMSVQRMTLLMKQKIDNFDVGKATQGVKDELGQITTASIRSNGVTSEITTEMRSRAETEYFATEEGQKWLDLKAEQMIANPFNQQSMMINANLTTSDGTAFEIGSQEDYDNWNKENPDNEDNNPYLVMEFGEDNQYHPKFNDAQNTIATEYAQNQIKSSLDVEQKKDIKKTQATTYHAPEYVHKRGDEKKNMLALGKNVNLLTSGDPRQRKAAAEAIGAETGADIQVVVDADGVTTEFIITKPGQTAKRISAFADDDTPLTVDELNRQIYEHAVEGSNYDQWLNAGGVVGENVGTGGVDVKQAGERIDYTPMAITDVQEFLGLEDTLSWHESTEDILGQFDRMLVNTAFWPESMKGIPKSVKEEGGDWVFTIGNETISFPNKNGQSVSEIITGVQNLMTKVVNDINQGGGGDKTGGKYNKKK